MYTISYFLDMNLDFLLNSVLTVCFSATQTIKKSDLDILPSHIILKEIYEVKGAKFKEKTDILQDSLQQNFIF